MAEDKALYRKILKSTTIFGGLQVSIILISIVRTKAIALLIGPAGMGIAGLLNAAVNLISGLTSVGLETSGVKYISSENENDDKARLARTVAVLRKAVWITSVVGALVTIALSFWLSTVTFGSSEYTIWFIWISLALLFKQLAAGQFAILQGLQKLKRLAQANFAGSVVGLLVSLPLYYYFKTDAIVPAIILSAATSFFFGWYFARNVDVEKVKIPNRMLLREGKAMLSLGLMLSISGVITVFVAYLIQIYIGSKSSLTDVGLYNAGITLLNSYVALIFSAMGTDYFPRLAAISDDNSKVRTTVLHQAQISILIITPIIILFLAFAPLVVSLLFSSKFIAIIPMVSVGIVGMLFRAVSWSMGFILLAKGDSKIFIKTAFGFNSLYLLLSVAGYYFYGLTGLGFAFTVHYALHFAILRIIVGKRYQFFFEPNFNKVLFICMILCVTTYFFTFIASEMLRYFAMALFVAISLAYSVAELHKKINLIQVIKQIKDKFK
ncbi:MAG TPA: O-antigen translocase [Flavobacterium sp.]|jgi:PST family polysaccharide transporter